MRGYRPHRGIVAERRAEAAAQDPVGRGFVMVVIVRTRANESDFIHHAGHARQQLADVRAGNVRGDWTIDAADLLGSLRLEIEAVMMRKPAAQVNENHRLGPRLPAIGSSMRLGRQQSWQAQSQSRQSAHAQEITARDAIASSPGIAEEKVQHGGLPPEKRKLGETAWAYEISP